jgi:hypothetical protein
MPAHPFTPGARIITRKKPDEDSETKLVAERFPPISDLPRGGADGGARGRPPIVDLPRKRRLGGEPPFYPYKINNALRLNAADNAYLDWTPSSDGSKSVATFSIWFKRTQLGVSQELFNAYSSSSERMQIRFTGSDEIQINQVTSGSTDWDFTTDALYRDPSAWFHFLFVYDDTLATATDRIRLYINGQEVTDLSGTTQPSQNANNLVLTQAETHTLGVRPGTSGYFDGYTAEVIMLDGIAASPTDFGQFKDGIWVPKRYTGSYGSNGFHLDFADAANLGKDVSGNGNDFTTNNITSDDQVQDTPTNNTAIMLPIDEDASGTLVEAATEVSGTVHQLSTFVVSEGRYAWETTLDAAGDIGIEDTDENETTVTGSNGDVIQLRLDADAGTLESNTNGGGWTSEATGFSGTFHALFKTDCSVDFGQYGYTPPTGFKALNAANLPKPAIINGSKYFNAVTYTGNGGTRSITGVGFQPDLVWIKNRDNSTGHNVFDTVRGPTRTLVTNNDSSETIDSDRLQSFDVDGFTVGSNTAINNNGDAFVAWCWKKGTTPGFDIVGYTGDGNTSQTISHNLGVAPAVMIVKNRTSTGNNWFVYHEAYSVDPETDLLRLDTRDQLQDATPPWNDTAPTASDFTVGNNSAVNANGDNYIAYLWGEASGFSRFGSYTGNGSSDGPFVWCEFRPAFVLIKRTDNTSEWVLHDTSRAPHNPANNELFPNLNNNEGSGRTVDVLSNGFKLRSADGDINANGGSYVFMAFAENPFKYSNAR